MVATDLVKLSSSTNFLTAKIGSPPDPSTVDVPIINKWHTVTQMYLKVRHSLLHALSLIQGNSENLEDFSTNYASLHSTYDDMLTQSMAKFHKGSPKA
jgi:hypothetical protein